MKKDRKVIAALKETRVLREEAKTRLLEADQLFNTEDHGFIETETERERTLKVTQADLKKALAVQNVHDIFNLRLTDFGPYSGLAVSRNGQHVLLGGRKGHLAMLEWKNKNLVMEFQARDKVRDVCFLQNHHMFAVAQAKYLHIYDHQGIELHCMRDHTEPTILDFLPYHFLLVTGNLRGDLKWLDVSLGKVVAEAKTKRGQPTCMRQNRMNGVMLSGHGNGEVAMWTPNMGSRPVVRMLAHPSAPLTSMSVSRDGTYLATTGKDSRLKIWDIRNTYKCLYDYFTPSPAIASDFSDKGCLGVAIGNEVQVWRNSSKQKQKAPYMKHKAPSIVKALKFMPFEDVMAIGHDLGYSQIVVPGSGEANFDAFEANPFATIKQRQEALVHNLLEKLQPDSISLRIGTIGTIDSASLEVKEREKKEDEDAALAKLNSTEKKRRKKMRGKGKDGHVQEIKVQHLHESMRERNKLAFVKEYRKAKEITETVTNDLEFLDKFDGKFDPFKQAVDEGKFTSDPTKRPRLD